MQPRLRPAEPADLDTLLGFMHQLQQAGGAPFDGKPVDVAAERAAVEELIANEQLGRIWLVEADGETVGYVILTLGYSIEFHGLDGLVDELFVAEQARSQGIGSAVLEQVEEACRDLGVKALHLEVEHDNAGAQRLYRRHGYLDHDRYLMTKRLDA